MNGKCVQLKSTRCLFLLLLWLWFEALQQFGLMRSVVGLWRRLRSVVGVVKPLQQLLVLNIRHVVWDSHLLPEGRLLQHVQEEQALGKPVDEHGSVRV